MDLDEKDVRDVGQGRFQRKNSKWALLALGLLLIICIVSVYLNKYWDYAAVAVSGVLWILLAITYTVKMKRYIKRTVEEWRRNG